MLSFDQKLGFEMLGVEISDWYASDFYSVNFWDNKIHFHAPHIWKQARADMAAGDVIHSSGTVYYTFSGLGMFPLSYVSASKFAGFENVSVPFGNFTAIKIQHSLTISGFIYGQYFTTTAAGTFWLVESLGIVKTMSIVDGVQSVLLLVGINFQPFISAAFTATQTTGVAPETVQFTDQSEGNISSWSWDFGDGHTSSAQNPTHVYTEPGGYSVRLTVSGQGKSDTETQADCIRIASPDVDINKDRKVDLTDLLLALQITANVAPPSARPEIADINGDMKTGLEEAVYILQFVSGSGR
jgi:hypothetical protein